MSHTPVGGHPQGWDHKLADRSSLPPASGEEKSKHHSRHVFTQPHLPKSTGGWREESEGSSGSSARSHATTPPYIRWARSLPRLLEDAEGVRLFRKFVCGAGGVHVDRLNFYFAVQGLRHESEPAKVRQVVAAIYKFLRKSQLAMPEELRAHVKQCLKDGAHIDKTIFDDMEHEVTRAITETTYLSFLRSEAYVSYVSAATQPLTSVDTSPMPRELSSSGLATLHEGQELPAAAPPARLTHDALLATQSRRLQEYAPRVRSVYNAHASYAGLCPASRQDSSRSASSVCDSDCLSDGTSMRGGRDRESSRHHSRAHRYGVINADSEINLMIPRTQRLQSEQLRVLPPAEFAPLLIERLERVKREQDSKERLERRLAEGQGQGEGEDAVHCLPPQLVAAAIRDKLQLDDDNDQDILDQHVSRVWSERTPRASPPPAPLPARRAASALSADSGLCMPPLSHRSLSKKTVTEVTDSGVSVASEAEGRVLLWVCGGGGGGGAGGGGERRAADRTRRSRNWGGHSKSSSTSGAAVGATSGAAGGATSGEHTVVVMSFLEESVPYRFKVPGAPLTLRALKEYLPKKGHYRYFFKTECADLDNAVIQEEVSSDSDILPMYEGKVMARVKSID